MGGWNGNTDRWMSEWVQRRLQATHGGVEGIRYLSRKN